MDTLQISTDHHTKEDGYKEGLLILKDNLNDQLQKQYQYMCQEVDNICWDYHTYYTDDLGHTDACAGNHIRFWFGVYLDE